MAFWGASIPGNGSYTLPSQVPPRRLRISRASNFYSNSDFIRLEIKVGENQPIPVAITKGSTKLKLYFEESDDVVLSVVGPTEIHLVGYYDKTNQGQDCYPDHKIDTSICPRSDVEPSREKSTKNVADTDSTEYNMLEERLVSNEHTPNKNIQGGTLGNQLPEQRSEPRKMDVIDPPLISHIEPGVIVGHNVADVDSMECNDLEDKLDSDERTPMVNIQGDNLVNEPQKQQTELRDIDAIVPPLISITEPGVIAGYNDEHMVTDSSDFSINAKEREEAIVVEIARHHFKAFEDVDADVPSSERENMVAKLDERSCDLVATGRTKQKKRKLVPQEKIQGDPIPIEPDDDDTRQLKRKETKKKKIRKVITGEADGTIEDSSNKKKSDIVPATKNKKAKKEKYSSLEKHEQDDTSKVNDDTSKVNDDTFEAPPTKVKSAKTKSKKPVTSKDPKEQSRADSVHIVLGLSSSRIAPNK